MASTADESIAIVGGGITGLFCAYILARNGKSVSLFEASPRFGGRIRTIRLKSDNRNTAADEKWDPEELEFCAEFGPMRLELDKQLLVRALLDHLKIEPENPGKEQKKGTEPLRGAAAAHLVDFPPYASPTMSSDPKYELRPDEEGKTPLQLLRMAMLRVISHLKVPDTCDFYKQQLGLTDRIKLAAATQEPVEPIFVGWMKKLKQEHYWEVQTQGCMKIQTQGGMEEIEVPLYAIGFWNLLSDYMSHDAITKLRDLGTFYHLLPENPNAAEWLVWWLIGLGSSEPLQGVFGGMECIVDKLVDEMKNRGLQKDEQLFPKCMVTAIERENNKFKLVFGAEAEAFFAHDRPQILRDLYDRVILALPKSPLEKIVQRSKVAFKPEEQISGLLDSVFAFPMVKLFVVVKSRWWEEANRANRFATKVPTRELHYWKGSTKDSKKGLIMLYTDRPASSFWANYIRPGEQLDANWARNSQPGEQTGALQQNEECERPLPESLRERLINKVVQYINENNLPDITNKDIVWYGLRDWGREPFGGANHAWRPERKYWVVMRKLASISESGTRTPSIHVCGEAYSDYHGFIEGSLRSAVYVLHCILEQGRDGDSLSWLERADIKVNREYLGALQDWVKNLDEIAADSTHLWDGD
jgi:monoamine oxidase